MGQTDKKKIAVYASGTGSNTKKIIEYFSEHPAVEVALIVCNKPGAGVLQIAADHDIPYLIIEKEKFFRGSGYVDELKDAGIVFLVLAGFLWKIPDTIISAYPRRILNIHPALLPKYGGKGMYGHHVHESVIAAGDTISGITIHYVDEHYDHGDIICQKQVDITTSDTAESLATKIHALEHTYYPVIIENILKTIN